MASIQFKGKNIIWNHHLSVPYHTLEADDKLSFQKEKTDGNLIIEGDNLLALKALLPKYSGQIKCIYIDPPYNTGNEGWVYNDNVNSPLIKNWIGKEVGKDDLTRHDKWLCMMTPRIKLLYDLLRDDGAIFISIDDNEYNRLKLLLEEVFGEENFVGTFIWRKKEGGGQTDEFFVTEHEYIIVFRKSAKFIWQDEKIEKDAALFNRQDEKGKYDLVKLAKWGTGAKREDRPKQYFPIKSPDDKNIYPIAPDGSDGRWRVGKTRMDILLKDNLIEWIKKADKWIPYEKIYFSEESFKTIKERSILYELAGTGDGTNDLKELFDIKDIFESPKPVELIKFFITYTTSKDSIILDSYAGSGTTGQAVLNINKQDNGKRKFILIQLNEKIKESKPAYKNGYRYVHEITRDRIKKAIEKYGYNSGFVYQKVSTPIDANNMLGGNLPNYKELSKYTYYLATGNNLSKENDIDEERFFVGHYGGGNIYLIYSQNYDALTKLALNLDFAENIQKTDGNKRKIVYAPACFLDEEYLNRFNIQFVSIPYNLFERTKSE